MAFRASLFFAFAVFETLTISWLFQIDEQIALLQSAKVALSQLILVTLVSAVAFVMFCCPRREIIVAHLQTYSSYGGIGVPLVVNIGLYVVLALATISISQDAALGESTRALDLFSAYCILLAATGLSLVWLGGPVRLWIAVAQDFRVEIALSVATGLIATWLGAYSQNGWGSLAAVTLAASYTVLSIFGADPQVDHERRLLGVGDFSVYVDDSCSGFEGVGLILVFLTAYLWIFRRSFRFPHALLLVPFGVIIILLFNALRIAMLVFIGASASPELAVNGFHSQAGWISFLLVTTGIMIAAPKIAFFAAGPHASQLRPSDSDRLALAFLAPFMSFMVAKIVIASSAPYDVLLYGLQIVAIGTALWWFRYTYVGIIDRPDAFAAITGAAVGVMWVLTATDDSPTNSVGAWIAAHSVSTAAAWLAVRAIGTVVFIPVAEELAFRGFLHRWLICRRFDGVGFGEFSWVAFVASSLMFGLMHQRWLAGFIAGAVFALIMYRRGRLSDPIVAHMSANAVIISWAIGAQQWSLL